MAGVQAGRLNIEIVAEIARLQSDLDKAKRAVNAASQDIARSARSANDNLATIGTGAGRARFGMQQLGMQMNDVATQFAMGTRPMQIWAQQSGQVLQSVQLLMGGTSRFAAFLTGPWGIAISTAIIALSPFIGKLFDTEKAADGARSALEELAEARQREVNQQTIMSRAHGELNDLLQREASLRAEIQRLSHGRMQGDNRTPMFASRPFRELQDVQAQIRTARQAISFEANRREQEADQRERARRTSSTRAGGGSSRAGRVSSGPSAEDIANRFNDQLLSLTLQSLSAMGDLATTVDERADLELRALEWSHRQFKQQIAADENFDAAQKAELTAAAERLAEYRRDVLDLRRRQELEQQAEQIADAQNRALRDGLDAQAALAETEADRKAIALQIFDAEQAYLRSRLEAVLLSETQNEHAKALAQIQLDALNATAAARRQGVSNANMTSTERFMADLNKSSAQMNEAFDQIKMRGLEALNEGLVDAIVNFRSLGDVARQVLKQILADLLRLQLQQMLTKSLASILGLGVGAGPVNLLAGTPFGGGHATGGPVSAGTAYRIGERGAETFVPRVPGYIIPHNDNQAAGNVFNVTVNSSGRMTDSEARRTGRQIASAAQREMARTRRERVAG